MAYARFGQFGSDVYVYEHIDGGLHCCGCSLGAGDCFSTDTGAAMIGHLREHQRAGDHVPATYRLDWPLFAAIAERLEIHLDAPTSGERSGGV